MCKNKKLFAKGLVSFFLIFSLLFSVWGIAFHVSANEETKEVETIDNTNSSEDLTDITEQSVIPNQTESTGENSNVDETEPTVAVTDPTEQTQSVETTVEATDNIESTEAIKATESQTEEQPLKRISFMNIEENTLEPVSVTIRIDGADNTGKVDYPAGAIEDNVSSISGLLDQNKNQAFRRAVVKIPDPSNPGDYTETQISRIGTYNNRVYYSYGENDDTGILLNNGEEIVLICESRFKIGYSGYESYQGEVNGKNYIWYDEELNISIKANEKYHIDRISVIWGGIKTENVNITDNKEMQLVYDISNLKDTYAHFTIYFEKDDPYSITAGQIQQGGICKNQGKEGDEILPEGQEQEIPTVEPGDDVTFMLYSQSWTGGDEWYLNMMTINGENVFVPQSYEVGAMSQKTVLSDGSEVTVTLIAKDVGLYWKDGDPFYGALGNFRWWSKDRCLYEVTVTDVKSDLVIDANFKIGDSAEMIMTGLEGIAKVGAAVTKMKWEAHPGKDGYYYYYSLETDEPDNVFPVHIKSMAAEGEQINFYVYSVLPGYNPYTVNIKFYSDGVEYPYLDKVFKGQGGSVNEGVPMDRIKLDEEDPTGIGILQYYFSSSYRKFIYETEDSEGNKYTYDIYKDILNNGYTHAFGIKETVGDNEKDDSNGNNQMVILSASPYEYHLEFNLNGGTYKDTGLNLNSYIYDTDNSIVTERKDPYTIINGAVTAYMPLIDPIKTGKTFEGWQLVDEKGNPVDDIVYSANEPYIIDESTIAYSIGDETKNEGHKFIFMAIWGDITEETEKAPYTIKYFKEVSSDTEGAVDMNGKYYLMYHSGVELGTIGSPVVVLNYHHPEPQENYVLDETNSKLEIEKVFGTDEVGYEENNMLLVLYNIRSNDLNITMTVAGDGDKTKDFQVKIKATDDSNNPITGQRGSLIFDKEGFAVIDIKHGETVSVPGMDNGYTYEIIKDEDGEYITTYVNDGKQVAQDEEVSGTFSEKSITVDITKTRELPAVTGVEIGNNTAIFGFIIASLFGILLVVFSRRRKNG